MINLTIENCVTSYNALLALDGTDKSVGDKVVKEPYKFDAKVRIRIARMISALEPITKDFYATNNKIIGDLTGGSNNIDPKDTETITKYNSQMTEAMNEVEELNFKLLTFDDLKLDSNTIPLSVLSSLRHVMQIEDEE